MVTTEKNTEYLTYIISGASVVLSFMDQHAAALGLIIAMITLIANLYYKWKLLKLAKKNGRKLSDEITDS